MDGKLWRFSRNGLAIVGLFSILAAGAYFAIEALFSGWGEKTVFKTATSPDSSAKATLYQVDAGAAAATRTYVALSNPRVDGSKKGDVVLSLLNLEEDANRIDMRWKANRLLVITYPAQASVEYSVSKTRGIIVELMAE
jgi:hypothetical protein